MNHKIKTYNKDLLYKIAVIIEKTKYRTDQYEIDYTITDFEREYNYVLLNTDNPRKKCSIDYAIEIYNMILENEILLNDIFYINKNSSIFE